MGRGKLCKGHRTSIVIDGSGYSLNTNSFFILCDTSRVFKNTRSFPLVISVDTNPKSAVRWFAKATAL